jgi:hypothetical protein
MLMFMHVLVLKLQYKAQIDYGLRCLGPTASARAQANTCNPLIPAPAYQSRGITVSPLSHLSSYYSLYMQPPLFDNVATSPCFSQSKLNYLEHNARDHTRGKIRVEKMHARIGRRGGYRGARFS